MFNFVNKYSLQVCFAHKLEYQLVQLHEEAFCVIFIGVLMNYELGRIVIFSCPFQQQIRKKRNLIKELIHKTSDYHDFTVEFCQTFKE